MTDDRFQRAADLCERAGVDPNEEIAKFVVEDYAAVLLNMVELDMITINDAITKLIDLRPHKLEDALLNASHWTEIFEAWAEDN